MTRSNRPPNSHRFVERIPEGDDQTRLVCHDCGFIHYENPKVVVGAVATWEGRILLCRRAIEPRKGFWTLPAGYLELHESAQDGALREAREEAGAELEIDQLLAVYSIPRISQIQLIFRARLRSPDLAAGIETEELDLFAWEDIPWPEIAFPSARWALEHHRELEAEAVFAPRGNPPNALGEFSEL
jgi:ADP-ribose pyrophosphatase YjhB (NUDIX family)